MDDRTGTTALIDYVDRGHPRGADTVMAAARRDAHWHPSYVRTPEQPPRGSRILAVAAAVVAIVVLGAVLLLRSSPEDGSTSTVGPATTVPPMPSPEELEAANQKLQQQMRDGWVPFANRSRISDLEVHGWIPFVGMRPSTDDPAAKPQRQALEPRTPIYDTPNGTVIAYNYPGIGPVDIATANSETFSPHDERIRLDGCETVQTDSATAEDVNACNQRLRDRAAAEHAPDNHG